MFNAVVNYSKQCIVGGAIAFGAAALPELIRTGLQYGLTFSGWTGKQYNALIRQVLSGMGPVLGEEMGKAATAGFGPFAQNLKLDPTHSNLIGKQMGPVTEAAIDGFAESFEVTKESAEQIGEQIGKAIEMGHHAALPNIENAFAEFYSSIGSITMRYALPYLVAGASITYLAINIINYTGSVWRYNIGKPELAQECRLVNFFTPFRDAYSDLYNWLYDITPVESPIPVFNEEITRKIKDIQDAIPDLRIRIL